jgi:TusA-related sulfurtransferase
MVDINIDYTLDITKEHCPMTFVKTKLQLSKMKDGQILEVILNEGEPLENVPRSSAEQGYTVLDISHVEGTIHRVVIKK